MKKIFTTIAAIMVAGLTFAQTTKTDSTKKVNVDTIRVGDWTIITQRRTDSTGKTKDFKIAKPNKKNQNIRTNWWIMDLGFANFRDKTNYAEANASGYFTPTTNNLALKKSDLELRNGKSSNVNLWLFMQRVNLSKHVLNLKYGFGLEMYNYRYETSINYDKSPARLFTDSVKFEKNKVYAGYATVPVMLTLKPSPNKKNGFSIGAGMSAGYLVASRDKQKNDGDKDKTKGNIGLDKWRLAYIAEVGLGPIKLYGSYSLNTFHEKETGIKQYPFAVGARFSRL